jgi:hypothetical protein
LRTYHSVRELTRTKLAPTCVKKVLDMNIYAPCHLCICACICIGTAMYRQAAYEEKKSSLGAGTPPLVIEAYRYMGCAARECLGSDFLVAGASLKRKK